MIAISFALPEESKSLVALLEKRQRQRGGALPWFTGLLAGREAAILHTGMGQESAARELERFLESNEPSALVAAGFGGGLDADLEIGDIFVGTNYSDRALLGTLGGTCRTGILVTAGEVIETKGAKAELARQTGAGCVDMETAEIFRQCGRRGIPMLAVRSISDRAGEDLPVPARVWFDAERQRPRPAALVWHLLTHPGRIAPFARFVGGVNRARGTLTNFLVETVALQSRKASA